MKEFVKRSLFIVVMLLLVVFLYYIRFLFIYFAFAVLFAYLMNAPVDWLVRRGLPRVPSILLVFIVFILFLGTIVLFTIPIITEEGRQFINDIPVYLKTFEDNVNSFFQRYYPDYRFVLADTISEWLTGFQSDVPRLVKTTFQTLRGFSTLLLGIVLVPLMVYYFLKDAEKMKNTFKMLFPQAYDERIDKGLSRVNLMLGNYVRGRLFLGIFVGTLITIGLTLIGIKYPLLLGILAGVAEFIPVLGPILAYIPAGLLALGGSPVLLVAVTILYLAVNAVETYLLVPYVMGETMDLHPLTVIIAMMIGAYIAGIFGLLIALPCVAAIKIILEIFVLKREELGIASKVPLTTSANPSETYDE